MESKLAKASVMLIATMLLVSVIPAFAVTTHPANAMWIEPPSVSLTTANPLHTIGYLFNVTLYVNVSTTQLIGAWQAKVLFDPTQLQVVALGLTKGTISEWLFGKNTLHPDPTVDNTTGYVLDGESIVGAAILSPGSGGLDWITFNVTKVPPKNQALSSVIDITTTYPGKTYVLDDSENAIVMTTSNCNYSFTWEIPPSPHMAVEHDGFYGVPPTSPGPPDVWPLWYGPYPPSVVGSAFNAKVYIQDLAGAWDITSASFCLCYNTTVIDVMGGLADITLDTTVWDPATSTIVLTPGEPDRIDFIVYPKAGVVPSGNVLVATVKFTIMLQQLSPPAPMGSYDYSRLYFCGVILEDHIMEIPTTAPEEGEVRILAIIAIPLAWLEVQPKDTVLGPDPSIGKEFDVNVTIKNLSGLWYVVAIQFRLSFDPTLLQLVSVTEGPFLQDPRWNLYGTFFTSIEKPPIGPYPHHVAVGDILMPNLDTGEYDQTTFPTAPGPEVPDLVPPVDPVLATIRFKAIKQNCFGAEDLTCALDILPFMPPEDCHFVDWMGDYAPTDTAKIVNGTYTMKSLNFVGRIIDLYGGAVNDGYGVLVGSPYLQFPAPYGGQGPNHWMDIVFPQSWVYLNANVTYNYWPVQSKDVGFEIEGPYEHISNQQGDFYVPLPSYKVWAKFTATTDSNGVATYAYRMPWPCDNPDSITGVWKITSTVTIADIVVNDTMLFYYERLVCITSVTTDSYGYYHDQCVKVTVSYKTHSVEYYPALFATVITDELGVPFGMALFSTTVGGATFCTWKTGTFNVTICIPKWAYAGNGYVHVSVYDKDPTIGGEPLAPEFRPDPQINIYPY